MCNRRKEKVDNLTYCWKYSLIVFAIVVTFANCQEVVSDFGWWIRPCCPLSTTASCRDACLLAATGNSSALIQSCKKHDETAFFECVQRQKNAQGCCSQAQSHICQLFCEKVLCLKGDARKDFMSDRRFDYSCKNSPALVQCMQQLIASTVHSNTSKYLACCNESLSQRCRSTCEKVLRTTDEPLSIVNSLRHDCGIPHSRNELWQCLFRKITPPDSKDLIPRDVIKLHCCQRATTINCRRLCVDYFNPFWTSPYPEFYAECIRDYLDLGLSQCFDEVDAPCSLGCTGLTYCNQLNNRHTDFFRSCSAQADLDAHLAVAEQQEISSRLIILSEIRLEKKNSSQCNIEIWKSVACALNVKPCTSEGHSSLLCSEDCLWLMSVCVDFSHGPPDFTARWVCERLTPSSSQAPCVPLRQYLNPSIESPLLSTNEAVTSPCISSPCNATQLCVVNRNCLLGSACSPYICVDGCALGYGSSYVVPIGSWVRVPMVSDNQKGCFKICHCSSSGLSQCQLLPCIDIENCRLHDKIVPHGDKYSMECNPCVCVLGEQVCAQRACGVKAGGGVEGVAGDDDSSGLPCSCPPQYQPVHIAGRTYPNTCVAKCAGETDAEIEFGSRDVCAGAVCASQQVCLPKPNVCLSGLQASCPQYICVNTTNCNTQPAMPICDTDGRTHANPCRLVMSGRRMGYWGPCLQKCSSTGTVCGVNGISYISECAAWAEYVSIDYIGPCRAVGAIFGAMEQKCQTEEVICPALKKSKCRRFTAPGACCPKCGGALRVLYSKKQIDTVLNGTNVPTTVINLKNALRALERNIEIAECAVRGYITMEMEIFISVETILKDPTDLQLKVCVLEAEKLADLINRESVLISTDVGLNALSYALVSHTNGACSISISFILWVIYAINICF